MKLMRRVLSVVLIILLISGTTALAVLAEKEEEIFASLSDNTEILSIDNSYGKYLDSISDMENGSEEIAIDISSAQLIGNGISATPNGLKWTGKSSSASFSFEVSKAGIYNLCVTYSNLTQDNLTNIVLDMSLDGDVLFNTMQEIKLPRWYSSSEIVQDKKGNDLPEELTPLSSAVTERMVTQDLRNSDPMKIYLSEGEHFLTLSGENTDILLEKLVFAPPQTQQSYEKVYSDYISSGAKIVEDYTFTAEAENTERVSSTNLIANTDRSDAATSPNHYYAMKLNTLGGSTWKSNHEKAVWKVKVPQSGLYKLTLKVRQNQKDGFLSSRRLYVNGEVPFEECNNIVFAYDSAWYSQTLSNQDGQPYYFYLNEGENTIELEVVCGDLAPIASEVDEIIVKLNDLYQQIVMVVGTQIDKYRDYDLENEIPGIMDTLKICNDELKAKRQEVLDLGVTVGSEMVAFQNLINQIEVFLKDAETIPRKLTYFRSYVSTLSTWSYNTVEQPLELDYIMVTGEKNEVPAARAGFFSKIGFEFMKMVASFQEDYAVVGDTNAEDEKLVVWISSGRDQLSVLKSLINSDFTPNSKIQVELAISQGSLSQVIMAGKAPNVMLFASNAVPADLGYRKAIVDLNQFSDFDEVRKWFMPTAFEPFEINDSVFAIPASQSFNVLFVRTDIFKMLNIEAPKTWTEFYNILPVIQFNNLDVGIPVSSSTFATLLEQRGLNIYKQDHTAMNLNDEQVGLVFKEYTEFFTKYDFQLSFDFYNRFRSGEMPIGIAGYTLAAQLEVLAPEIKGLWEMYPIPGVENEDGTINNSSAEFAGEVGTCSIILENTKENEEASWEFLKWFNSADVQAEYSNRVEAILGPTARAAVANVEAFSKLAWSTEEQELLMSQWKSYRPLAVLAGNYYVGRHLNNAFRAVVYKAENPVHTLKTYSQKIDAEIERKLKEFAAYDY